MYRPVAFHGMVRHWPIYPKKWCLAPEVTCVISRSNEGAWAPSVHVHTPNRMVHIVRRAQPVTGRVKEGILSGMVFPLNSGYSWNCRFTVSPAREINGPYDNP